MLKGYVFVVEFDLVRVFEHMIRRRETRRHDARQLTKEVSLERVSPGDFEIGRILQNCLPCCGFLIRISVP